MADKVVQILHQQVKPIKLTKWKVSEGNSVSIGCVILLYDLDENGKRVACKMKASRAGTVRKLVAQEGCMVQPGECLLELQACIHPTVMRDMCAECGADLRTDDAIVTASVPMVHSVPELKVSLEQAQQIGKADLDRLLKDRKLVLLVDLDQTLIHTTNDNIPANIKDVYHFQLYGPQSPWYHTRLRPGTHRFLENMSPFFELHICTFGARNYAHMIAMFLDEDGKLFSQRILSRDECFNPTSKTANLKALFPCGDDMVCIIDDREDVWSYALNLIHVKPYHFFQHTGDINAPPGLDKHESDEKEGVDLSLVGIEHNNKAVKKINGVLDDEEFAEKEKSEEQEMFVEDKVVPKLNGGINEVVLEKPEEEIKNNEEDVEQDSKQNETNKDVKEDELIETDKEIKEDELIETNKEMKEDELIETNKEMKEDELIETNKEMKEDELIEIDDTDDYLLYLEDILVTIHKAFYDSYDQMESGNVPDLKKVIPEVRRNVLEDTSLVFSGLVPTHIKLEQSKVYQVARSLGATVTQDLQETTTHLVAVRPGTAKVNVGRRRRNLKIVTPDWLWACAERWTKVDEKLYPLNNKGSKNRHPPPHCSPERNVDDIQSNALRKRTPSGRFMDSINPLMSFSSADIADMDREVEDIFNESESDGETSNRANVIQQPEQTETKTDLLSQLQKHSSDDSSSSEESLTSDHPHGWRPASQQQKRNHDDQEAEDDSTIDEFPSAKFRRGEQLSSDLDIGQESNSEGSVDAPDEIDDGDWNMMGAALEREFLAND